jgi:HupE / UreJ protein
MFRMQSYVGYQGEQNLLAWCDTTNPLGVRGSFCERCIYVLLATWLSICPLVLLPAEAHDVSRSESRILVRGRGVRIQLRLNLLELRYVDANHNGFISLEELDKSIAQIYSDVSNNFSVRAPDLPIQTTLVSYKVVEDHVADMQVDCVFSHDVRELDVTSTLFRITQPGHQHLTSAELNGTVYEAVLTSSNPSATFIADAASTWRTFWSFLRLGVTHIFTGYDHLAFLLCLLIGTNSFASLVKIITSFTVAHSITLALATFDVVVLSSRLTESVIALSIAYVAIENLIRRRTIERYQIVFIFGLAHGFGFSSALREMELSRNHLALSLFSFNSGVELGQLTFILVLFPVVNYVIRNAWRPRFDSAVSLAVLCLAAYWFVQRAFLG